MARHSRTARTRTRTRNHRGSATRALPWVLLGNAIDVLRDRPYSLSTDDRNRLRGLVAKAGGRGINLSPRERNELALILERSADAQARTLPTPLVASRRRRVVG